jgi:hypothetical protein
VIDGETKTVYTGFNRDWNPSQMDILAVCSLDGELDVLVLDNTKDETLKQIAKYVHDQRQKGGKYKLIGFYTRDITPIPMTNRTFEELLG